jgi:protein involved in ribonucleotide reduction
LFLLTFYDKISIIYKGGIEMKIVYASRTGNVSTFVDKLGESNVMEIQTGNETVNEKFVLVTYTDGYGEVPQEVDTFLANNNAYLVGVAASGDQSYGDAYCLAADVVSEMYAVPVLAKFEFDGTMEDVTNFLEALNKL